MTHEEKAEKVLDRAYDLKPSLALRLMRVMYSTPEAMLTSDRIESVADEARKWAVEVVNDFRKGFEKGDCWEWSELLARLKESK